MSRLRFLTAYSNVLPNYLKNAPRQTIGVYWVLGCIIPDDLIAFPFIQFLHFFAFYLSPAGHFLAHKVYNDVFASFLFVVFCARE